MTREEAIALARKSAPWAALAGGLATATLAGVCALALRVDPGRTPPLRLPATDAYNADAGRLVATDPARARAMALKAVSSTPVDGHAWLILAAAEAAVHGRLGKAGLEALARSYDVAPFDQTLLADRAALAYDHWPELTDDLRSQTRRHMRAYYDLRESRVALWEASKRTRTPAGRIAIGVELFQLRMAERARNSGAPIPGQP